MLCLLCASFSLLFRPNFFAELHYFFSTVTKPATVIENLSQLYVTIFVLQWEFGIPRNTGVPRDCDGSLVFQENFHTLHDIRVKIQFLQS